MLRKWVSFHASGGMRRIKLDTLFSYFRGQQVLETDGREKKKDVFGQFKLFHFLWLAKFVPQKLRLLMHCFFYSETRGPKFGPLLFNPLK